MTITGVALYSTAHCPYCEEAKKFLAQHNVTYTEYRIDLNSKDAELLQSKTGRTATPAIFLPDGQYVVGFNPVQLEELLDLENPR